MTTAILTPAAARAAALAGTPDARPCDPGRSQPFRGELRATAVMRDGKNLIQLEGYASVFERAYEMWDLFGTYEEIISAGAADKTLASRPDVAWLVNHRGVTMARTTNGTLDLSADTTGLHARAFVNPERSDVRDLAIAIEDKQVTEMSFAFTIPEDGGKWSPDFTVYRINEFDINRGDVSAVNYGANPYTSVAARAREVLADLEHLPVGAARAAIARLEQRINATTAAATVVPVTEPARTGRSIRMIELELQLS